MNIYQTSKNDRVIENIARRLYDFVGRLLYHTTGSADLRGKLVLLDSDELLLVWERGLRDRRLKKEEEAWKNFEREFGKGSPKVTEAFIKWQESLYAYIAQERARFLRERPGTKTALNTLVGLGAKTIVVTKGAKPYTQKCFNLLGLSTFITSIYSPPPGSRQKQFVDAVLDHGIDNLKRFMRDTVVVGHDLEKDMAWDLVPPQGKNNGGNGPVFILLDTMAFDKEVIAPLDAIAEVIELLSKRGQNDFWRGFKSIKRPEQAKTRNYTFSLALYGNPQNSVKAKIPVIYNVRRNGTSHYRH